MLANYHTHTIISDGQNTAEEVVLSAIEKGFGALGFSDHAYTFFDTRYCMDDTAGYIKEINQLKEKYKREIQIYCGTEEDAGQYVNRADFDYIVGSSHYVKKNGEFYSLDTSISAFEKCLEVFNGDALALAKNYYEQFCDYIKKRKPDIVGHFDLITKFSEKNGLYFDNPKYFDMSEEYMKYALENDVIFEVNTNAIAKGWRTSPYPYINLLHIIKNQNGKVLLSSDSHHIDTLDFKFGDVKAMLRDIGFKCVYMLYDGQFQEEEI